MALTIDQIEAIVRYVAGGHVRINSDCRCDSDGDPEIIRDIYFLDQAMKGAALTEEQIVYRGVGSSYAEELERRGVSEGDTISDKAFLSTSRSETIARGFLGHEEGGLLMKIRLPKGSIALDLAPYSSVPDEEEYLLPRETMLKVLDYHDKENVLELEVE